jgi:nucleoside permease NupC
VDLSWCYEYLFELIWLGKGAVSVGSFVQFAPVDGLPFCFGFVSGDDAAGFFFFLNVVKFFFSNHISVMEFLVVLQIRRFYVQGVYCN